MNKKIKLISICIIFLLCVIGHIYNTNNTLLNDVDILVSMYNSYTEEKTDYLRYSQYLFALIIIFLISFLSLILVHFTAKNIPIAVHIIKEKC